MVAAAEVVVEGMTTEEHQGGIVTVMELFLILIMMAEGAYTQEIATQCQVAVQALVLHTIKARWCEGKMDERYPGLPCNYVNF